MRRRQRGIVLMLTLFSMVLMLGMAGFALDLGLAYLNKTRLQNALDAAALDGAKTLSGTHSTTQAQAAALDTYAQNMSGGPVPVVTFSSTQTFPGGGGDAKFVKVELTGLPVTTYLSRFFGMADSFTINGVAMAGPLSTSDACGAPLGICGTAGDTNCTNGDGCYGILPSEVTLHDNPIGPGNYGLLQMGSGCGQNGVGGGLAGSASLCLTTGQTLNTQPGICDVDRPLNTRFGTTTTGVFNNADYQPDVVTAGPYPTAISDYESAISSPGGSAWDRPLGVPGRRTFLMPVLDCGAIPIAGVTPVTVLGHACMFLTRPVPTSGSDAGNVYVQLISECLASGGVPDEDGGGAGSARIVLFQIGSES